MTLRIAAVCIFLLGLPYVTYAAVFESDWVAQRAVGTDHLLALNIYLNPEEGSINALEGTITYDPSKLSFKNVVDGDSVVGAWLQKVSPSKSGTLAFSGVIPGGYAAGARKLFTLYFLATEVGQTEVRIHGQAYRNDGKATALPIGDLSLRVETSPIGTDEVVAADMLDTEAPSGVTAVLAQNEAMFDGKKFIIVDSKDGKSGIAQYEILQSDAVYPTAMLARDHALAWKTISNPSVLDTPLKAYVYVRVTDRVGNAAVVALAGSAQQSTGGESKSPNPFGALGIIMGSCAILLVYLFRKKND